MKDKKLTIHWDKVLFPIKSVTEEIRGINGRLEPPNNQSNCRDLGEIYSQSPQLLASSVALHMQPSH